MPQNLVLFALKFIWERFQSIIMNRRGRKTDSKAMVTRILDTLIENAVNHSKIVATEIIDGERGSKD